MGMEKDKILITGGSGFIGTNLVQYFIDRKITFINVDIRSPSIKRITIFGERGTSLTRELWGCFLRITTYDCYPSGCSNGPE